MPKISRRKSSFARSAASAVTAARLPPAPGSRRSRTTLSRTAIGFADGFAGSSLRRPNQTAPIRYVRLEIDLLWASVVATCLVAVLALYSFRSSRRSPVPVSVVAETKVKPAPLPAPSPGVAASEGKTTPYRRTAPPSAAPDRGYAPEVAPVAPQVAAELAPAAKQAPGPSIAASRDEFRASAPTRPVLIHRVEPIVPEALRRSLRSEGPITAEAVITENGDVTSVRILPPVPAGLERPITEALRNWKYKPALLAGRPVSAYLNVVIYVNSK